MHPQSHCLIHIRLTYCNQFYKLSPIPWGRHFKREYSICGYAVVYLTFHTGRYLICFYLLFRKKTSLLILIFTCSELQEYGFTKEEGISKVPGMFCTVVSQGQYKQL